MITQPIYVISDLHLSDAHPELLQAFEHFIDTKARHARALYILGDLFEAWVGDDDNSLTARRVCAQLKMLKEQGVSVYYMHGNRDFLVGKTFINQSGAKLLPDPSVIPIDGHNILMSHGDLLCTHDKAYQRYRFWVHQPWVQTLFLALPRSIRERLGNKLRMQSSSSSKDSTLMDVNEDTVREWFEHYQVGLIIHGHTHHPLVHEYTKSHSLNQRLVLGAWEHGKAKIACLEHGQCTLTMA